MLLRMVCEYGLWCYQGFFISKVRGVTGDHSRINSFPTLTIQNTFVDSEDQDQAAHFHSRLQLTFFSRQ